MDLVGETTRAVAWPVQVSIFIAVRRDACPTNAPIEDCLTIRASTRALIVGTLADLSSSKVELSPRLSERPLIQAWW